MCSTSTGQCCSRVQGLRFGTGVSGNGLDDRVLSERLLTIEWRQRELPEVPNTPTPEPGC